MSRLLMVELAAVDRFHRAVVFPYVFGFARELGVPARWLRFGVPAARRHLRGEAGVGLEVEELERLTLVASEHAPTVALFNMQPSPEVVEALRRASPGVDLALLGETYAGDASMTRPLRTLGEDARQWARLLGSSAPDEDLSRPYYTWVCPDFGYEATNEAARATQPLPFIVLGRECTYNRPFSRNPGYAGVDLSGVVRQGGCAFCSRPDERGRAEAFTIDVARRQLEALARTVPRPAGRLAIRLLGEPALDEIEQLAALCAEVDLPASDLLIDGRADRLLRREPELTAAARTLEGSEHRLRFCLLGVESFSAAALERMNKGVTPFDLLDAIHLLRRLERDHPRTFNFSEDGGLSMILFTPWTTLEELATNLAVIRDCGLEGLCGKLLGSRLRLEPALAITALARRDGLLIERYDDRALDTAARNLYGEELPWRFLDPAVEPICRILVRCSTESALIDDPLSESVSDVLALARQRGLTPVDLAIALVRNVRDAREEAGDAVLTPEALLATCEAELRSRRPSSSAPEEHWRESSTPLGGRHVATRLLVEMTRQGSKPVSKIEPVAHDDVRAVIERFDLPCAAVREPSTAPGGQSVELFFGRSDAEVERAIELTGVTEEARDDELYAASLRELGVLFGYPACCVDRYAAQPPWHRESYVWLHLARRLETPGPVPPEVNPCTNLLGGAYVPCRLDCQATLDLLRAAHELSLTIHPVWAAAQDRASRRPWLLTLVGQGQGVELLPEDDVGDRFRFRAGSSFGRGADVAAARRADEVVLDGASLILLRRGTKVADLSMRAFLWWHERALQRELWQRVLDLRAFVPDGGPGHADDEVKPLPRLAALGRLLEAALAERPHSERRFEIRCAAEDRLVLVLDDDVVLNVRDAREGSPCLIRVGPFALSLPHDASLDSPHRRAVVDELAEHLARWLRSRARS